MDFAAMATSPFAPNMVRKRVAFCFTVGPVVSALPLPRGSALFGLHLQPEMIRQIIHLAAEGVGVRATARLLELDKDTVNRVILRAGDHCAKVLSELLTSLEMTEVQLDELWTFIKKKKILAVQTTSNTSTDGRGSGRPSTPPRAY